MGNSLEGRIESFIYDKLTNLENLNLSSNDFTSSISPGISKLSNLKSLILNHLLLTGTLPDPLKGVTTLEHVSFWDAIGMNGNIFRFMQHWPNLITLDILSSSFTGTIPTEVGLNTNLKTFWIEDSRVNVSNIPTELGTLTNLNELGISSRFGIEGATIPTEIGRLTNLDQFLIKGANYIGSIPTELGLLTKLAFLTLQGGRFTGTVPSEFGALTLLKELHILTNDLTGTLPSEIGNLSNLLVLELYSNRITGAVPEEVCSDQIEIWCDCDINCPCCYVPCF